MPEALGGFYIYTIHTYIYIYTYKEGNVPAKNEALLFWKNTFLVLNLRLDASRSTRLLTHAKSEALIWRDAFVVLKLRIEPKWLWIPHAHTHIHTYTHTHTHMLDMYINDNIYIYPPYAALKNGLIILRYHKVS